MLVLALFVLVPFVVSCVVVIAGGLLAAADARRGPR